MNPNTYPRALQPRACPEDTQAPALASQHQYDEKICDGEIGKMEYKYVVGRWGDKAKQSCSCTMERGGTGAVVRSRWI